MRDATLTPAELTRIGTALYRGVSYNGRASWQSWLADGLAVDAATIRRWLMEGTNSRRSIPVPTAKFLVAAEGVAEHLKLWNQPRGTVIADRMADVILGAERSPAQTEKAEPNL